MKKLLLVAFAATGLASCNNDDNGGNPTGNEMALKKVETFTPSQAIYTSGNANGFSTRRVSHFQNDRIVADTVFDISGSVYEYSAFSYTPTTQTISTYTQDNQLKEQRILTLDTQGRVTNAFTSYPSVVVLNGQSTLAGEMEYTYTYNGNTVTSTRLNTNWLPQVYELNSAGVISIFPGTNPNAFSVTGDKLTGFDPGPGYDYFNFNYYATSMPASQTKTPAELNNMTLVASSTAIAFEGNYYLQSDNFTTYTKTFNTLNYILTDKAVTTDAASYGPTFYDERAYERFYYYE